MLHLQITIQLDDVYVDDNILWVLATHGPSLPADTRMHIETQMQDFRSQTELLNERNGGSTITTSFPRRRWLQRSNSLRCTGPSSTRSCNLDPR